MREMGEGVHFWGPISIEVPHNVTIGKHCTFNRGVLIGARDRVSIGNYVRFSAYSMVQTMSLEYTEPRDGRGHVKAPVIIEDGAWICAGAMINAGVTIGRDSVVGPGSVVLQDVPPNVFVMGVPARVVREIKRADVPSEVTP